MTVLPQLERELRAAHVRRGRRWMRRPRRNALHLGALVPAAAAVVAIAVVVVFAGLAGHSARRPSASDTGPAGRTGTIAFRVVPLVPATQLGPSLAYAAGVLQHRLNLVLPHARVTHAGDELVVSGVPRSARATVVALSAPGELFFYDWEADALTPSGQTVAAELAHQDAAALRISQGGGASGPGAADAGGMPLYPAVSLAAHQPAAPAGTTLSRPGPELYEFGTPGSSACTAAYAAGRTVIAGQHCLLSGPAVNLAALQAGLPPGVSLTAGRRFAIRPGTVVVQAESAVAGANEATGNPNARFFVLRDRPALSERSLTSPRAGTDASGQPDVQFGFTATGARAFQAVTATEARRGADLSTAGMSLDQHFAAVLDGRVLSVPSIDFRQYPEGITQSPGSGGADLTGGFTSRTARETAALLRYGGLAGFELLPLSPG